MTKELDGLKSLQDWQVNALKLRQQGYKSRAIALEVLGRKTAKSSVNYFFNDYDSGKYELVDLPPKKELQVLYFDLENSPEQGYFWNRWKTNISEIQVERYSHLLSVAYAFNDGEVKSTRLTQRDVQNEDDLTAVVDIVQAINKADIIVTFNGKKFDLRVLKTRMMKWGLPPLKPVKHIDIYQIAKQQMRFPSNSMDNISKYLGYSIIKTETGGFQLWKSCLSKNPDEAEKALRDMEIYNQQDIAVTRNLFKQFQGWSTGVNVGVVVNQKQPENQTLRCTKCGGDDISVIEDGFAYTATSGFQLYRCGNNNCRGVSRISGNGKNLVGVI